MKVLAVRNVNEAYSVGVRYVLENGIRRDSRAGSVISVPHPVATVYANPRERVLFSPSRDANPFFHLFEALWLLSGRKDAKWLDRFVGDFSARFAEDDGLLHGAYGSRWRNHFDVEGDGLERLPDQLETVIRLLQKDPTDRRVVLSMWDPVSDLAVKKKDIPCNTHIYPRIIDGALDITVCCRSNDAIWGAYGANAVHFSLLQEYLAARIGVRTGVYIQFSNDLHIYENVVDKFKLHALGDEPPMGYVVGIFSEMVGDPESFDDDLARFMEWSESDEPDQEPNWYSNTPWLAYTAEPLFVAHHFWRQKDREHALEVIQNAERMAIDWKLAAKAWMRRRMK